eukprot:TRINITY_DN33032_c0_g1_i1.p1 TRINITY_DN33032_c0_g1~~TRINITY_DN33032_c0_g1_i1.p1  ORF type:complete len:187 (-),score=30.63 TRINITY_DN33032_c0_g1_i1:70-630(-)
MTQRAGLGETSQASVFSMPGVEGLLEKSPYEDTRPKLSRFTHHHEFLGKAPRRKHTDQATFELGLRPQTPLYQPRQRAANRWNPHVSVRDHSFDMLKDLYQKDKERTSPEVDNPRKPRVFVDPARAGKHDDEEYATGHMRGHNTNTYSFLAKKERTDVVHAMLKLRPYGKPGRPHLDFGNPAKDNG